MVFKIDYDEFKKHIDCIVSDIEQNNYTLYYVCKCTNVSTSTISKLVEGTMNINKLSVDTLLNLSNFDRDSAKRYFREKEKMKYISFDKSVQRYKVRIKRQQLNVSRGFIYLSDAINFRDKIIREFEQKNRKKVDNK